MAMNGIETLGQMGSDVSINWSLQASPSFERRNSRLARCFWWRQGGAYLKRHPPKKVGYGWIIDSDGPLDIAGQVSPYRGEVALFAACDPNKCASSGLQLLKLRGLGFRTQNPNSLDGLAVVMCLQGFCWVGCSEGFSLESKVRARSFMFCCIALPLAKSARVFSANLLLWIC